MGYLKMSFLFVFVLLLALVHAQHDGYEVYERQPNVRARRDVSDFILRRSNGEHLRFRRDDDSVRHRRQGGGGGNNGHEGITGPVHTFVKTDEHAHFKWGVRHNVGHEYAGHGR